MKRRMRAMLMAVVMLLLTVMTSFANVSQVKAAGDLVVKLHYNRPDGNYDDWDVWMWEEGKDGAGYPFENENGEMVALRCVMKRIAPTMPIEGDGEANGGMLLPVHYRALNSLMRCSG